MSIHSNNREFTQTQVLTDVSEDETTSSAIDTRNARCVALHVEAGADVTDGTVLLEGAISEDYSGTWVSLGSVTTNGASKLFSVSVGEGATTGFPVPFMRARVSTVISGGTISATIILQR